MNLSKADRRRLRNRKRAIGKLPRLETKYRFVDHPRFGDQPIRSGETFSLEEVRRSFSGYCESRYDRKIIFAETAIRAEVHKQNHCGFPRRLYVDIARPCRNCGRWFIFFALEQKHWFEALGFYVDADCLHCQECRHAERELREMVRRYSELLAREDKSAEEWQELSRLGDALYGAGYIKKAETLLKTRRPKRMGH